MGCDDYATKIFVNKFLFQKLYEKLMWENDCKKKYDVEI